MSFSRDIERYADLFAARTKVMKSSAMRDLMAVTARPEIISLAGGLPDTSTFPAEDFAALMARVRPLSDKPLIVKLTPNVSDVVPVALAAQDGGADALSLINTLRASAVDPRTGAPWLGARQGGLSGPAVRPVALAMTMQVAARTHVPVVGMGGIQCGRDALDFIDAGAACVAVGTESFRDPAAGTRVREALDRALCARGDGSAAAATNAARDRLRAA